MKVGRRKKYTILLSDEWKVYQRKEGKLEEKSSFFFKDEKNLGRSKRGTNMYIMIE